VKHQVFCREGFSGMVTCWLGWGTPACFTNGKCFTSSRSSTPRYAIQKIAQCHWAGPCPLGPLLRGEKRLEHSVE
jgi:hypothetical protein